MKKVIIINGKGGVGKDTFCNAISQYYTTSNISSIDTYKHIAKELGWNGGKDLKSRKFLSDLKQLSTSYNNRPFKEAIQKILAFEENSKEILFIHIREIKEIEKVVDFCKLIDIDCKTLLIKSKRIDSNLGNDSDDNVEKYEYDYVYNNDRYAQDEFKEMVDFFKFVIDDEGGINQ